MAAKDVPKNSAATSDEVSSHLHMQGRSDFHGAAQLLRSGSPDLALCGFNEILRRAPNDAKALNGRGLALASLGRKDEALGAFRAASAADPSAWAPVASIADTTPDESQRIGAVSQCADILIGLCRRSDTGGQLFDRAANALSDAHRFSELADFARRYRSRFINVARAYDWRAKASYELGEFGEALSWKRAALRLTPLPAAGARPVNRLDPGAALEALTDFAKELDGLGLTFFLAAGTALGFFRSGGPLSHDRDIDIGIFRNSEGGPDIAGLLRRHPRLMLARSARPADRYFALMHRGIAVDIFLHDTVAGSVTCGVSNRPGDIKWRFSGFTLQPHVVGGQTWNLPHPIERYLAESYGANWTVPNRGFASAISSPALTGVDVRVRSFYAASRARAALLGGDTAKARALIDQSPLPLDPHGSFDYGDFK